jgi:hypothetical protein
LDVIAILRRIAKSKTLVSLAKDRTAKVQYTSVKEFRKSGKSPLSLP